MSPLVHVVDWPEPDTRGFRAKLTCGHFTSPASERAEEWNIPDLAWICPEGCGTRQLDLELQVRMVLQEEIPAEDLRCA